MKERFEIRVEGSFSAAHHLRDYGTHCENPHGHNWKVVACVGADRLDARGVCVDFKELRAALREVLDLLDHRDLNGVPPFDRENPSAENIARFVYEGLSVRLGQGRSLASVRVAESEGCWAIYRREGSGGRPRPRPRSRPRPRPR